MSLTATRCQAEEQSWLRVCVCVCLRENDDEGNNEILDF